MIHRAFFVLAFALAAILPGLAGCSVYDGRYLYEPRLVSIAAKTGELSPDGAAGAGDQGVAGAGDQVRTLVSVIGVRRDDQKSRLPASVEVRLRVENDSESPVGFSPEALALVAADLQRLPEPIVEPAYALEVAPGADAVVNAYFPLEDREIDLSALNLRWSLFIDGRRVSGSSDFTRRRVTYVYPHHHHHYYSHLWFGHHHFYCW